MAWDPVARREVWRVERGCYSGGGVLSTRGGLVFQGDLAGRFRAFAADSGAPLWDYPVQGGIMAAPISYELDGDNDTSARDVYIVPMTIDGKPHTLNRAYSQVDEVECSYGANLFVDLAINSDNANNYFTVNPT